MQRRAQVLKLERKGDFIDFITYIGHSSDKALGIEFTNIMETASATEMMHWFTEKGYDVPLRDCEKLKDQNEHLIHMSDVVINGNY